jgi:hypothetical protein
MNEEKLNYGSVSSPVKIGNTVHRQTGPWTPTVHALLNYLHQHGFVYSPLPLGIDKHGREILNYIDGEAAIRPWPKVLLESNGIDQAAKLLRKYHDVIEGFVPSTDAEWRIGKCQLKPNQIIRHGDLGPWNTIWQGDKLAAFIDWDFASPGERIDDLAQMAYYFVPLRGEDGWAAAGFKERPDIAQRLNRLVKGYGMFSPREVVAALIILLKNDREITKRFGDKGIEPWLSFMKRGDIEDSLQDGNWLERNEHDLVG